ncbi:hypothetical protein [Methylobacterium gossipiicola]|uniref:hypothetical protein n=1 Tax=Methylobacterium gossipiicola TaxID=582675 RepID=UPI0011600FDA|nr:hypothetical protein [Methylobacterium gossipiicola]
MSKPHREALIAAGQPVPNFVLGTFLADTGASVTCVDPGLVAPLSLTPTGVANMMTPSTNGGTHSCYQYDVALFIPPTKPTDLGHFVDALPVMETHLRSQGIDGLLGRDVLQSCVLISNGPSGIWTLAF